MFIKPKHIMGKARPDPGDHAAQTRAEAAEIAFQTIWIDTPSQLLIRQNLRSYMRTTAGIRGKPLNGRRLSQFSQAGKSSTMDRLKYEVDQEAIDQGLEPNPFRIVHVTIDQRMTLKMFFQKILKELVDDFSDQPGNGAIAALMRKLAEQNKKDANITVLEQRIAEWVLLLGVDLLVVDEIQRLYSAANDAGDVTQKLQAFLDRGVVPVVLVGDETSEDFFKSNKQFAARLARPLELLPLDVKNSDDRKVFKQFCKAFDAALISSGATVISSDLAESDTLTGLIAVSGGHVGRVARLLETALPAAIRRGAPRIERYDLFHAVEDFAIGLAWIDHNPFFIEVTNQEPDA